MPTLTVELVVAMAFLARAYTGDDGGKLGICSVPQRLRDGRSAPPPPLFSPLERQAKLQLAQVRGRLFLTRRGGQREPRLVFFKPGGGGGGGGGV